jgi:uncharacterized protein YyaL (SSP411 family)
MKDSPADDVRLEVWAPAPLAQARHAGWLVVLLVDAAWRSADAAESRAAWARAVLPPERGAAVYVLADQAADPAVTLRSRWILRLFDVDESFPYGIVCATRPRSPALLPLCALAGRLNDARLAARDRTLATWLSDRGAAEQQAVRNRAALVASARRARQPRPALETVLAGGIVAIQAAVEPESGGLLGAPGALRPTVYRLLVSAAARGDAAASDRARLALTRLAQSGMRDPLDGGFFCAARDAAWRVPDFARTAAGNAALLAVYSAAAVQLGEPAFADVARGTAAYLLGTLRDAATGAFFASQAADEPYYTWTTRQVTAALPFDRVQAACLRFSVQPRGGPLHDQSLNVLYPAMDAATLAPYLGCTPAEAGARIAEAEAALLAARAEREPPPLDRTLYVDTNAQVVSALLAGAAALGESAWRARALEALARLEAACFPGGAAVVPHRLGTNASAGAPWLGDYAALGRALLDAHAATGEPRYLARARAVASALLARFRDARSGALLDAPRDSLVTRAFWPEQPFEDDAGPAPAAQAAALLLDIGRQTGHQAYHQAAADALRRGAAAASDDPPTAAGYFLALYALLGADQPGAYASGPGLRM